MLAEGIRQGRRMFRNRPATLLLVAAALTVGLTFLLFVTPAGAAFGLAPQPPRLVGAIVAIVILYAVLTEAGKRVYVRLHRAD